MATRYVGPGGNDGNSGLTWALRKLTLNGVEDTPVVANDVVYVGPGVYRELLIIDVSGNAGNPITYIADVSGENTDGVGGIVRITGSDDDQTENRAHCIDFTGEDYRTFRGFTFDTTTSHLVDFSSACTNIIFEDCVFHTCGANGFNMTGPCTDATIRRCLFLNIKAGSHSIIFTHSVVVNNSGHLVENCIFIGSQVQIRHTRVGGGTIKNCLFLSAILRGIDVNVALDVGQQIDVNNCIFQGCNVGLQATALGEIVENYNTFYGSATDRITVNIGANSQTYPALLESPIILDGLVYPWWYGKLSEWSQIARITGTGTASDDLFGIARPATASKLSWGAIQYRLPERDTGTTRGGSAASIKLDDAGEVPIFVPVDGSEITISVYVYREANYAGNLPQMIIRQPGAADQITTDVGAVSTWNQLTDTFTPNAEPPYVQVFFRSRNTAVAGNYDTFFDDMDVT